MSKDHVDVVRRVINAYNRRDIEALRELNAPDIEVDWSESRGPQQGVYHGRDELMAFMQEFFESFETIEMEPERFIERADDIVVPSSGRFVGRQGVETSARSVLVFRVEDGLVTRLRLHQTMPDLDVEKLIRWGYAYFNREHEPPPTWLPDGEFVNAREDPDHATYRGIEAIRKQHQGWFDSYPDLHIEPREIRPNGDGDRVFVWAHFSGHGADSGVAMDMELAHVLTIDEDGRTRRLEEFFDRAEGLRAAGIEG
ncbi:MAG TPA: nuclear transport factor 2 family protein [Thermoleophilaceae bacterium]